MLDAETTALLRAVLNEVCESVSQYEIGARTHVASKILEAATRGETSVEGLKRIGRSTLCAAPHDVAVTEIVAECRLIED